MMQKDVIRLYTQGVRSVTITFSGGEDSGGIDETNVDIPKDFILSDDDEYDFEDVAFDLIHEYWGGFTGTPYVNGTVVLELQLTGNLKFEVESLIDMGHYDRTYDENGTNLPEGQFRNNFEDYGYDDGYNKHSVNTGVFECEVNDLGDEE